MKNIYEINEETARRAKEMNSFSDYTPGEATSEYRRRVEWARSVGDEQKRRVDAIYHSKIDYLVDLYARKLAENWNEANQISCRCPSILIVGGGNFPTRKKEKQVFAMERNYAESLKIEGIISRIRSTGTGGIRSDEPNALEKLQEKLNKLEEKQQFMKTVNAFYRRHKTLEGCPVLSEESAKEIQIERGKDWHLSPSPFPAFKLSNNNAEIHRIRDRISSLDAVRGDRTSKESDSDCWTFSGGKVVLNRETVRLQIFFDEKPSVDVRSELKRAAFHWSPSAGAWQRQLTDNAIRSVKCLSCLNP